MSDMASMVVMSSPSAASSGGEPDCDEPPEPPNQPPHHLHPFFIPTKIELNDRTTKNSTNINHTEINSNEPNHIMNGRRHSSCSILSTSDDENSSATSLSPMPSPSSLLSTANETASDAATVSLTTNTVRILHYGSPTATTSSLSSATVDMMTTNVVKDPYESKEMKIPNDPRFGLLASTIVITPTTNTSIHDDYDRHAGAVADMKDTNLISADQVNGHDMKSVVATPTPTTSRKPLLAEEEHKEASNEHKDYESKQVELLAATRKEEKKSIVMLATAMLDSSHTADKQIAFNLGKLEMIADLSQTLEGLGHTVRNELVSHANVNDVVSHIKPTELVFNLCDGTDEDGVVGVSLVHKLEEKRLAFTGACSNFYIISSAKSRMKQCFEGARVPTMPYRVVEADEDPAIALAHGPMALSGHLEILKQWPLFVKPDDAYGSMGISDACVCRNQDELMAQCRAMREAGFKRLMVEGFLDGDEFSVLMTDVQTYPAVKKVYLREGALCLDFKADWIDNSYEMVPVPDQDLDERLRAVAQMAYASVAGNSYARVDLRIHRSTGIICVLEVNSQPGIGDNSTAWDVLIGYAGRAKLTKAAVTAQFLQDIVTHPRRGLLPLGTTVDNVPHADPE